MFHIPPLRVSEHTALPSARIFQETLSPVSAPAPYASTVLRERGNRKSLAALRTLFKGFSELILFMIAEQE